MERLFKLIFMVKNQPVATCLATVLMLLTTYISIKLDKLPEETAKVEAVKSSEVESTIRANLRELLRITTTDRALVALYRTDKDDEIVFSYISQVYRRGVVPVPDHNYHLYFNNYEAMYLKHLSGDCVARAYPETNTKLAVSCPILDNSNRLLGFLEVNSTDASNDTVTLEAYVTDYVKVYRPLLYLYNQSQKEDTKNHQ